MKTIFFRVFIALLISSLILSPAMTYADNSQNVVITDIDTTSKELDSKNIEGETPDKETGTQYVETVTTDTEISMMNVVDAATISAELGYESVFNGLTVKTGNPARQPIIAEKGGKDGWGSDINNSALYLNFSWEDSFFADGNKRVEVAVEYFDEGHGKFALQYKPETSGNYVDAEVVQLTGTDTWKVHRFILTDFGGLSMRIGLYTISAGSSPEDVFFNSIVIKKIEPYDQSGTVSAMLGEEPDFNGLVVKTGNPARPPIIAEKGGLDSWGADPAISALYLNLLPDPLFYADGNTQVEVSVKYYDEGAGKFTVQYRRSADNNWTEAETVQLTGSNTWKVHRFVLTDSGGTGIRVALYADKMGKSPESVYFNSIEVKKYVEDRSTISAELGYESVFNGLTVKTGNPVREPIITEKGGHDSWGADPKNSALFLNLSPDPLFYADGNSQVEVSVKYYDEGMGKFTIGYRKGTDNSWTEAETVQLTGSNTWKVHRFILTDSNGNGMRVALWADKMGTSPESVYFKSIVMKKIEPYDQSGTVSAILGEEPNFKGLIVRTGNPARQPIIAERGGLGSWGADPKESALYLNLSPDPLLFEDGNSRVEVSVKYFDEGMGKFTIGYRKGADNSWSEAETVQLTGSNTWKVHRFVITDYNGNGMRVALWASKMGGSPESVYFHSITIKKLASYATQQLVVADLGGVWNYQGINAFLGDSPFDDIPVVTVGGREGGTTNTPNGGKYLYFNIDDTFIYNEKLPLEIEIAYFDQGYGSLQLEYDSTSSSLYKAPPIALTNTQQWKSGKFQITNVKFSNRANRADFRLYYEPEIGEEDANELIISRVTVSKDVPDLKDVVIQSVKIGNVFIENETVEVDILSQGIAADDIVNWTLTNYWGTQVSKGSIPFEPSGSYRLQFPQLGKGHYTLHATVVSGGTTIKELQTTIAVLSPNEELLGQDSPFVVSTHYGHMKNKNVDIPLLAHMGVSKVRDELYWEHVEKTKNVYTFPQPYEDYMAVLKDNQVAPFTVLSYSNSLYNGGTYIVTEESRIGFGNYAKGILERFGDQIKHVEVYNEYNAWAGGSTPQNYYLLLKQTYTDVKSIRPDVKVIGPAAVTIPFDWIEELFKLGGLNYLDGVSIHPYMFPQAPEGVEREMDKLNKLIAKYNDTGREIPIWVTETGWPTSTDGTGISEERQAEYLVRNNVLTLGEGVETITWYNFKSKGVDPRGAEDNFGIIRNEEDDRGAYTPKPAYTAYAILTRQLTGAEFVTKENIYGNVYSYVFQKDNQDIRVMWSLNPQSITLNTTNSIVVTDLTGEEQEMAPLDGKIYLKLGGQPFYVKGHIDSITTGSIITANNISAAINDSIPVNVVIDNTGRSSDLSTEVEIAGIKKTVMVKANEQSTISLLLPPVKEISNKSYIANVKANGNLMGHLIVNVAVEKETEFTVIPQITDADDMQDALKLGFKNLSSSKSYTLTKAVWQVGDYSGTQLYDNVVIQPSATWSDLLPLTDLAYWQGYQTKVVLSFKDAPSVSYSGRLSFSPIIKKTLNINTDLDPEVPDYSIDISKGTNRINGYGGMDDLSGNVWFNWDEDALYLSAKIKDNIHHQTMCGSGSWTGDGIQFALYSGMPSNVVPERYEYGIAMCDEGVYGVYRWITPLGVSEGEITNFQASVVRDEENKFTYYKLALPWEELSPVHYQDEIVSLSVLVNDNDGVNRKGYIEWTGGIGSSKSYQNFLPAQWVGGKPIESDQIPPVTTDNAPSGWSNQKVTVKLTATDEGGSGVAATYYKLNGSEQQTGNTVLIEGNGEHTLTYWSVDKAGNIEQPKTVIVRIRSSSGGDGSSGGGWNPGTVQEGMDITIEDGKAVVQLDDHHRAEALVEQIRELPLVIRNDKLALTIQPETIKGWMGSVGGSDRTGTRLVVKIEPDQDSASLVPARTNNVHYILSGQVYHVKVSMKNAKGEETELSAKFGGVLLTLPYDSSRVDEELIGIYAYDMTTEKWKYAGRTVNPGKGMITAELESFGTYAVMEYSKTFVDVTSSHWAARTLQILASKHIVTGINESEFQPSGRTTRAEFTAMLVRMLGLESNGRAGVFSDVNAKAWYAGAVNAAYDAGLINGVAEGIFNPEASITREQMAMLLVKAYEYKHGQIKIESANSPTFADSGDIADWSTAAVNKAVAVGLMQGRGKGIFAPKSNAVRAETAQAIYNFIKSH